MYAVFCTLYTRNQDGTCTKQSQVVEEYFEAYWDALTYLGDERVVHVYLHEVEVLTIEEVCFIIVACVVLYISEGV